MINILPFLNFLLVGALGVGVTAGGFWYLVLHQVGVVWIVGVAWVEAGLVWSFVFEAVSVEVGLVITTLYRWSSLYLLTYKWFSRWVCFTVSLKIFSLKSLKTKCFL